jgi:BASS family bile acid:Na+ symporter
LKPFDKNIAEAVYITVAAPTAIAVPVVISLLKRNIEYSIISLLFTNFIIASILPFTIPYLLKVSGDLSIIDIMIPVATVFLIPFVLAKIIKRFFSEISSRLIRYKDYTFYLLVMNVYLASSKASNYISNEMTASLSILFFIGIIIFVVCIFQFGIGYLIGEKTYKLESSQCLGQKNNGFTIWVALTFISPIAALGPVFYIVFQNVYISWQLYRYK